MKTALMISGIWREWDKGLPSVIESVIEPLNCDVFIDTWDKTKSWNKQIKEEDYRSTEKWKEANYNFWENIPNLKSVRVEKAFHIDSLSQTERAAKNLLNQFRKIKNCFLLVEDYAEDAGIEYDFLIRARIDLHYENKIDVFELENLEDNSILIPKCQMHCGFNDQWFCGRYEEMKTLCHVYDNVGEMMEDGIKFHPESMLGKYAGRENLTVYETDIVKYGLIRNK